MTLGYLVVGKDAVDFGIAILTSAGQFDRARTVNRAAKISRRIQAHTSSITGDLATQGVFQGAKYVVKQATHAGGANDCKCRK